MSVLRVAVPSMLTNAGHLGNGGWIDGWMMSNHCMDDGWMIGWLDGWVNEEVDRWMDG